MSYPVAACRPAYHRQPSGGGGVTLATYANRQIYLAAFNANVKTEEDGTGTVTDGTEVGYIAGLGSTPNFVNATSAQRPLWNSANNALLTQGTSTRLECATPINLTGAFYMLFAGFYANGAGGTVYIPISAGTGSGNNSTVFFYSDGNFYINAGSSQRSVGFTATTGKMFIRVWRDASNQIKVAGTGMAATNVGSAMSGTVQLQAILGRPVTSEGSTDSNRFRFWYVTDNDAVAAGDYTALEAEAAALYPDITPI